MEPGFEYPSEPFKHHDGLYYPSEDAVFIVTKSQHYSEDDYNEVAIWGREEIRLIGTLILSVPEGGTRNIFVPWVSKSLPKIPLTADLSSESIISLCLQSAIEMRAEAENEQLKGIRRESLLKEYLLKIEHFKGKPYIFRTVDRSNPDIERTIFDNIDPTDGLLIRGLYTLIKSLHLCFSSYYFMEEAFMNLQISLQAALERIREHLHYMGNPNPSFNDAKKYIISNFQFGKSLVEVIDMLYEAWIETKHPNSDYGQAWAPSIIADDIYDTFGFVVSIYRHIVLDEPGGSSALYQY